MKTIETKLYSYNELNDEAKEHVFDQWQSEQENTDLLCFTYEDMQNSLKGLCDCLGVNLLDYSYGPYCRGYGIKVSYPSCDTDSHQIKAYIMRNLINAGYERKPTFRDFAENSFPGVCAFTGTCYDDNFAQQLCKEIMIEGNSWNDAWNNIAYEICKTCEAESEYLTSREYFEDTNETDEEIYTEEGEKF
jgi:hypothetical protein